MIIRPGSNWFLLIIFITPDFVFTPVAGAQEAVAESQPANRQSDESTSTSSATTTTSQPTNHPVLLRGQVTNRDRLAPVDAQYRTGASLDVAKVGKLKALSPHNHWDRIPEWSAGTWVKKTSTTFYTFTYGLKAQDFSVETDMARSAESRGWQRDRAGNIWEYSYQNYFTKTECEDTWAIGFVKDTELLEVAPARIVMRFVAIRVVVDKSTRTILRTFQCESIQTYTPHADGIVKIVSSIKSFDEDGNPLRLTKVLSFEQRALSFSPVDEYRGHDMRPLFAEYLTSQGLASLVPTSQHLSTKTIRK